MLKLNTRNADIEMLQLLKRPNQNVEHSFPATFNKMLSILLLHGMRSRVSRGAGQCCRGDGGGAPASMQACAGWRMHDEAA